MSLGRWLACAVENIQIAFQGVGSRVLRAPLKMFAAFPAGRLGAPWRRHRSSPLHYSTSGVRRTALARSPYTRKEVPAPRVESFPLFNGSKFPRDS